MANTVYTSDPDFFGHDVIDFRVFDNGNTGLEYTASNTSRIAKLTIEPVNDPPVIRIPDFSNLTLIEGEQNYTTFQASIHDVDVGNSNLDVILEVSGDARVYTQGSPLGSRHKASFISVSSHSIAVKGNNTQTLAFTGRIQQVRDLTALLNSAGALLCPSNQGKLCQVNEVLRRFQYHLGASR